MPQLYIGGRWEGAREGERREIRCPADGSLVAEIDEAGPEDTARGDRRRPGGVRRGHRGRRLRPIERGALLHRVADLLERDKAAVARAESLDTGKRLVESEYDVDDVVGVFRTTAASRPRTPAASSTPAAPTSSAGSSTSRSASAALITPWNYPLLQTAWKVAPCARRRQHLRAQAQRAHPAHRDPPDGAARGGRACPPGSRTSCSAPARGPGALLSRGPPRRPGLVHRRAGDRPRDHGLGRRRP